MAKAEGGISEKAEISVRERREGNSISIGPIAGNDRIDVGRDSSSRRQRVVPRAQLPLCTQACIHTNTDVACMLRVPRGYRERIIFTHTPRKTLDNRDAFTSLWGWTWTRRVWRDFYSIEKVSPASSIIIYIETVRSRDDSSEAFTRGLVVEEVKKFSFFSFDE